MINQILNEQDVKRFESLINRADNIVLTCHVCPDGDAIGSTLGFYHLLRTLGKSASVVTPDLPPKSLTFLPGFKDIVAYTKYQDYAQRLIGAADLIICCDFNKPERQDSLSPLIQGAKASKVLVDHHLEPDNFTDITFSFPEMSSASELVFRLIAALGLYGELNVDAATCICTGIVTDTRNLSVNCSNPELYLIMYELIKKGVDKSVIVREALEARSYDCIKLQSFALCERLEMLREHRTAVITLSTDDLKRFNYERGDTEGLVNIPLEIPGVVASYFLRQDSDDMVKVSARSISSFPVSKVCEENFGGGGHLQAAGGEFHGSLEECRKKLIDCLPDYDKYLKKIKSN